MKKEHGFTLIELMIGIAILAILLSIAVPSFRDVIQRNRVATITNDLVTALQMARSEAVKRRTDVTVCRRNGGGTACDPGTDWSVGWLVATPGAVLRVWDAPQGTATVTGPNAGTTFRPSGMADAISCIPISLNGQQRHVAIGNTGRVASGTGVVCP